MSNARITYYLAHLYVLVLMGVLLGAFGIQFIFGEIPCPLCYLQRMGMALAAMGPCLVILHGVRVKFFGMTIVAAILGGAISTRQILLHIANTSDPGYGTAVMGLHLYTWAFIVFVTMIGVSGLHLWTLKEGETYRPARLSTLSKCVLGAFALILAANAVSVFVEAGWHWFLPGNPTEYRLLH
ncbi:MAG: disulfide bond formation protein B [Verrucomicrobiales bacterium]